MPRRKSAKHPNFTNPRMWQVKKRCAICNHNLYITRLQKKYWCKECREYRGFFLKEVQEEVAEVKKEINLVIDKLVPNKRGKLSKTHEFEGYGTVEGVLT